MTNEEKHLLIKTLCGYFPYGVICSVVHKKDGRLVEEDMKLSGMFEDGNFYFLDEMGSTYSDKYIPYLRPMSSMTEKEFKELTSITELQYDQLELVDWGNCYKTLEFYLEEVPQYCVIKVFDWLDSHYFDYRDLIKKGLALEAPFGMYDC
jgi:hypothetical protein